MRNTLPTMKDNGEDWSTKMKEPGHTCFQIHSMNFQINGTKWRRQEEKRSLGKNSKKKLSTNSNL